MYYFANIQSHLLYGITIWYSTYQSQTNILHTVINKAIKLIYFRNNRDNVDTLRQQSNVPTLKTLWLKAISTNTFKIINNILPNHNLVTYNIDTNIYRHHLRPNNNIICIKTYRTNYGLYTFEHLSSVVWNYLNGCCNLKNLTIYQFKQLLKTNNWNITILIQ